MPKVRACKAASYTTLDVKIVQAIWGDILQSSINIAKQRKREQVVVFCSNIVLAVTEDMLDQCERAQSVSSKIASLTYAARQDVVLLLQKLELDEISKFDM